MHTAAVSWSAESCHFASKYDDSLSARISATFSVDSECTNSMQGRLSHHTLVNETQGKCTVLGLCDAALSAVSGC